MSRAPDGSAATGVALGPSISADGRMVAFLSDADNLSPDDVDTVRNVYVRDVRSGTTSLVSRADGIAGAGANGTSTQAAISGDGRFVVFVSRAANLSPDDDNSVLNVFVRDLVAGTTTLVSRADGIAGAGANGSSTLPSISADGRLVAFGSTADNLSTDDDDSVSNVFVRDRSAGTTTLVSRGTGQAGATADGSSDAPSIAADGSAVAFVSTANNLSTTDDDSVTNIFVRGLAAGTTTLASRAAGATGGGGNGDSRQPSISADGRVVAFRSAATNLSGADTNGATDIFVRDLAAGTTTLASRAAGSGDVGDAASTGPSLSRDGRWVAFESAANNLSGEDASYHDVFSHDLQTGALVLISRAAGPMGAAGDGDSGDLGVAISADGRYVAFDSLAANISPVAVSARSVLRRDVLGPTAAATNAADRCAAIPPPPASRPPGRAVLSRAQMRINQRIGQAAILRLAAVEAWLDGGIETRDICGGAIGPAQLASTIVSEPVAASLGILPSANPRPIEPAPLAMPGATFRLTAGQLLVNQRISQAAMRRANALKARLDAGLTGGDVKDGAITQGLLHDRLAIVRATADSPAAPSRTVVAPPQRNREGVVRLNAAQLRIGQRIAQEAVRRANTLVRRLSGGLTGTGFRNATIGVSDLAPGVVAP